MRRYRVDNSAAPEWADKPASPPLPTRWRRRSLWGIALLVGSAAVAASIGRASSPECIARSFVAAAHRKDYATQHDLLDARYRSLVGPGDSARLLADLGTNLPASFDVVGADYPRSLGMVTDYHHYHVRVRFSGPSSSWEGRQWFVVTLVDDGAEGWHVAFYPTFRSLLSTRLGAESESRLDAELRRRLPREYRSLWQRVGEATPSLAESRRHP